MKPYIQTIAAAGCAALIALSSCSHNNQWEVTGVIADAENELLVLEGMAANGNWYMMDTLRLSGDGKFSFKEDAPNRPEIYRLTIGNSSAYFPVDSIETITVNATAPAIDRTYKLSGTPQADMMQNVNTMISKSGVSTDSLKRQISELLLTDPAGITAYYIINKQQPGGAPLFNPADRNDLRIIGAVANAYTRERPGDPRTNYLTNLYIAAQRATRPPREIETDIEASEIQYPDIALLDENGKEVKLSDVVGNGKPTILNFTTYSSDFAPALNVLLNKIADDTKGGVNIYQVGLDSDEFNWHRSASNLPWTTVYNSPKIGAIHLMQYNVGSIPATFLFNSNGDLVARIEDLSQLESNVKKLL
ncbi:MAG: DUF4369 domain-containing protein [Muribaculaceae bacterium]|nr:DUF4369 domain-containing protein [Muribaculaceae bacterium]